MSEINMDYSDGGWRHALGRQPISMDRGENFLRDLTQCLCTACTGLYIKASNFFLFETQGYYTKCAILALRVSLVYFLFFEFGFYFSVGFKTQGRCTKCVRPPCRRYIECLL
jgi:hypothetical protein